MFNLFNRKNKVLSNIDIGIKYENEKKKSDAIRSSVIAVFMVFILFFVGYNIGLSYINSITKSAPCVGMCLSNQSDVMYKKGFFQSGKANKKLFIIDYKQVFTNGNAEIFADKIDYLITRAKKNDTLLIHIESPGGMITSCGHSYNQLKRFKKITGAKIVAITDYLSASCGYQLSSAADYIVASSSAMIGNIGSVYHVRAGVVDTMIKHFGGKDLVIGSTRVKELLAGAEIKTKADIDFMRSKAIRGYRAFIDMVLVNRGNKISDAKVAFSGDIFSAKEAKKLGLIDFIDDYRSFIYEYNRIGYDIFKLDLVKSKTFMDKLINKLI